MTALVHLTSQFAVSPQLEIADVERLAALGFRAIVAVRPDDEVSAGGPSAEAIARKARAHGLEFRYAPAGSHEVTEPQTVAQFESALRGLHGPVLAYCKSGSRAAIVWALAAAHYHPAVCVGAALSKAGVDPALIADELQGRSRKRGRRPAALTIPCDDLPASSPA